MKTLGNWIVTSKDSEINNTLRVIGKVQFSVSVGLVSAWRRGYVCRKTRPLFLVYAASACIENPELLYLFISSYSGVSLCLWFLHISLTQISLNVHQLTVLAGNKSCWLNQRTGLEKGGQSVSVFIYLFKSPHLNTSLQEKAEETERAHACCLSFS